MTAGKFSKPGRRYCGAAEVPGVWRCIAAYREMQEGVARHMMAVGLSFLCVLVLLGCAGCEPVVTSPNARPVNGADPNSGSCVFYAPAGIDIMPLTELKPYEGYGEVSRIDVYVSLLDDFGSQMKSPGVFRFELYERVYRSADRKGGRVVKWPDVRLTEPAENNKYWRDFLRAYEFTLDFTTDQQQDYILQVTYLLPGGTRLAAEYGLRRSE